MTRMENPLVVFLSKPALVLATPKERAAASLCLGILVFFMIVLFRPAQVNPLPFFENLIAALTYGFISFLISLMSQLFLQNAFMKNRPTNLRQLTWLGINLLAIGSAIALTSVLAFRETATAGLYLQAQGGTIATGMVILPLLLLFQRNRRLRDIIRQRGILGDVEIRIPADGMEEGWTLHKDRILFIKALENYIDLFYVNRNDQLAHRLIRSTMKKTESALMAHREFLRCHRSYIVNTSKIRKLRGSKGANTLEMELADQMIPVSRGSMRKLKEILRSL